MYYRNFTAHMIDFLLKQKSNGNKKKNGKTPKDPNLKEAGHSNRHDVRPKAGLPEWNSKVGSRYPGRYPEGRNPNRQHFLK